MFLSFRWSYLVFLPLFLSSCSTTVQKISWATDLHFDSAEASQCERFLSLAKEEESSLFFVCGDIAEKGECLERLVTLQKEVQKPVYFVLGNHDFHGKSIAEMRQLLKEELQGNTSLVYLTQEKAPIPLSIRTALIGDDGWCDGQSGDFMNSPVMLRDYIEIEELKELSKEERFEQLKELGKKAKRRLVGKLYQALLLYDEVILLLHAPPFREACLYNNIAADDDWAPHFSCKSIGDLILEVMPRFPDKRLLVLCGHTHHAADYSPLPNVRVLVGEAQYTLPQLQPLLKLETEF